MNGKTKRGSDIFKIVLSAIVLVIIGISFRSLMFERVFEGNEDNVYINDDGYILTFNKGSIISLYHYNEAFNSSTSSLSGTITNYKYVGLYYNKFIGRFHFYRNNSLLFWNNFAFYDDNNERRARIKLTLKEQKSLLNYADYYKAFSDDTFVEVIETKTSIEINGLMFKVATGEELKRAKSIMNVFLE